MDTGDTLREAPLGVERHDEVDELFAGANPNPERADCPPDSQLVALAERRGSQENPIYGHIEHCSRCYRRMRDVQDAALEARARDGLYVFAVAPRRWCVAEGPSLARALRRAVMSRAGQRGPNGRLSTFFTGHENDGRPAAARHHQHLFYLADDVDGDGFVDRLAIIAPHLADPSSPLDGGSLSQLARAIAGLEQVRAGTLGLVELEWIAPREGDDPIFGTGRCWTSRTAYRPTRHPKRNANVSEWVSRDITQECLHRGLPQPSVRLIKSVVGPRGGLLARFQLVFPTAIRGPLMLGAGSHFGEGVFAVECLARLAGATLL